MHKELESMFEELEKVRNDYFETESFNGDIFNRVEKDKWSIGESIYHVYLELKMLRRIMNFTRPLLQLYTKVRKPKVTEKRTELENFYEKRQVPAPFILSPKKRDKDYSKGELREMLENETEKYKDAVRNLDERVLFGLNFKTPFGDMNVFQLIKIALIHERHHYEVVLKREMEA